MIQEKKYVHQAEDKGSNGARLQHSLAPKGRDDKKVKVPIHDVFLFSRYVRVNRYSCVGFHHSASIALRLINSIAVMIVVRTETTTNQTNDLLTSDAVLFFSSLSSFIVSKKLKAFSFKNTASLLVLISSLN